MNKIIILNLKEMTVKYSFTTIFIVLLSFISCISQKENNKLILWTILEQSKYNSNTQIVIDTTSTYLGLSFFKLRSNKTRTLLKFIKTKKNLNKKDTANSAYRKAIKITDTIRIIKDEYLKYGRGTSKIAELFLKDSFLLKKEYFNWNISTNSKNLRNETIYLSKPLYNFKNNKAIMFQKTESKNNIIETVYFLKKTYNDWKIIYSQNNTEEWSTVLPKAIETYK